MSRRELDDERRKVADEIFEMSIASSEVIHATGYEDDGKDELSKVAFLFNDAEPEGESIRAGFGVSFVPDSAEVIDVHGDFDASPWFEMKKGSAPSGP